MRFAMNHIAAPSLTLEAFFEMSKSLGITQVEIRNDLPDIMGRLRPEQVKSAAQSAGITILSINALYPFNQWSGDLPARATAMADYAQACGARALVMCPLNDGTQIAFADLVNALKSIAPLLEARGLIGLIEPLGFPISSLRSKAEAIRAILASGHERTFKILHDTFHHHLAAEAEIFPEWTGLVHLSGVTDPTLAVDDMLDRHRGLIDAQDRLDNIGQIAALLAAGVKAPFSFEPFAPEIHALPDPQAALTATMEFVRAALTKT